MEPQQVFYFGQTALVTLLYVSGPIMIIALVVGLIIALFQALTSIQEITLTFVPKILLVFLSLLWLLPFMAHRLNLLAQEIFNQISATGG